MEKDLYNLRRNSGMQIPEISEPARIDAPIHIGYNSDFRTFQGKTLSSYCF